MNRTITALHTLQNGETVTALGNLPGPDDYMSHDDLLRLANQVQSAAIDNRRIAHAPLRHPVTPGYLEYPEPPSFDESCDFGPAPARDRLPIRPGRGGIDELSIPAYPVGIDSEGVSHE